MSARTRAKRSEVLFRGYCEQHGYDCTRIEESRTHGVRSPDFRVLANGRCVIVEVKELEASKEEVRLWRETRSGKTVLHGREPGKRARSQIEAAVGQLRRYAEKDIPCVVALYDNVHVDGIRPGPPIDFIGPLGCYDIDVALYGLQTANLRLHPDGSAESLGDGRSRRRRVHDLESISAVAVLYEHPDNENLFLFTYHNFFARRPLPEDVFAGKDDRHFLKPKHPDLCPGKWSVSKPVSD